MEAFVGVVCISLLVFALMVALSRWIFRVNYIVDRLDSILNELKKNNGSTQEQKVQGGQLDQTASFI
jgi:hypothetical protein